jgi:hypothetical protein
VRRREPFVEAQRYVYGVHELFSHHQHHIFIMHFSYFVRSFLLTSVVTAVIADNFDITVGKDGQLAFNPPTLNALPGSKITYHFYAKVRCQMAKIHSLQNNKLTPIEPLSNSVLIRRPMSSYGRRFLFWVYTNTGQRDFTHNMDNHG